MHAFVVGESRRPEHEAELAHCQVGAFREALHERHRDREAAPERLWRSQQPAGEDDLGADGRLAVDAEEHRQVVFDFRSPQDRHPGVFAKGFVVDRQLGHSLAFAHPRVGRARRRAREFERRLGARVDAETAEGDVQAGGVAQAHFGQRRRDDFARSIAAGVDAHGDRHRRFVSGALGVKGGVQADRRRGRRVGRQPGAGGEDRRQERGAIHVSTRCGRSSGSPAQTSAGRTFRTNRSGRGRARSGRCRR